MKSEFPAHQTPEAEVKAPTSRFLDEKISDEFDTEATADKALAPAGLNNPFWN